MFSLTDIETDTILHKGLEYAEALVQLAGAFKTEYLHVSRQVVADLEYQNQDHPEGLGFWAKRERQQILRRLQSGPESLWEAFFNAKVKEQEFYYCHDLFRPKDVEADAFLTRSFQKLMSSKRLNNPAAVASGRQILEQISREKELCKAMGFDDEFERQSGVASRAYDQARRGYAP